MGEVQGLCARQTQDERRTRLAAFGVETATVSFGEPPRDVQPKPTPSGPVGRWFDQSHMRTENRVQSIGWNARATVDDAHLSPPGMGS